MFFVFQKENFSFVFRYNITIFAISETIKINYMKTDIEIAQETKLERIENVAAKIGIAADELEHYGKYIAKLPLHLIGEQKGKLILVTAITATKAGIGKTTVSIGLALGLNKIGKRAVVALREHRWALASV